MTTERAEFAILIGGLWASFHPDKSILPETIAGYWLGLRDLPLSDINRAVGRAVRELKFFPRVSELRELAGQKSGDARAVMAWQAVRKQRVALRTRGRVVFDDAACTAAVASLGVERLYHAQGDDLDVWCRKDFIAAYNAMSTFTVAQPLEGIERRSNLYILGKPAHADDRVVTIKTGMNETEPQGLPTADDCSKRPTPGICLETTP